MSKRKESRKRKNIVRTLKKNRFILVGLIALVLVVGLIILIVNLCGKKDGSNKDEDTTTTTIPVRQLKVIDENSNSRNVAVMINNISTVWGYQSGIQDAYIVYEIIVEGGITRLMALYKDADTARIGSVRSSREYFLDYVLENDAMYVHVGGAPAALSDIKSLKIADMDATTIWRDTSLNKLGTEHTAFTSIEKIMDYANSKGYRITTEQDNLLNYSVDEIDLSQMEGAISANDVYIQFSGSKSTSFTYNAETKVYGRSQNKKAHTDYVTGEQYTVKNIITYQVANTSIAGDEKGRQALSNEGSGTGYFISDGYAVPITWEKKDRSSQTVYKYLNGEEIVVNDGNTHIEIQPKGLQLSIN